MRMEDAEMFDHLLLPLDLTDRNEQAIATAIDLAGLELARVTLLHVIEAIEGNEDPELADFYRRLERRAHALLDPLLARFKARGIAAEAVTVRGKRAASVVRWADTHDVDLIVLTSRRLDATIPVSAWPTISHRVALLASQPVLLVREPTVDVDKL